MTQFFPQTPGFPSCIQPHPWIQFNVLSYTLKCCLYFWTRAAADTHNHLTFHKPHKRKLHTFALLAGNNSQTYFISYPVILEKKDTILRLLYLGKMVVVGMSLNLDFLNERLLKATPTYNLHCLFCYCYYNFWSSELVRYILPNMLASPSLIIHIVLFMQSLTPQEMLSNHFFPIRTPALLN